jgi:hypothetical protein
MQDKREHHRFRRVWGKGILLKDTREDLLPGCETVKKGGFVKGLIHGDHGRPSPRPLDRTLNKYKNFLNSL